MCRSHKTTISLSDFIQAFEIRNRGTQFSHAGLTALYDHIKFYIAHFSHQLRGFSLQPGDLIDEELRKLDVIELCCVYAEYDSLKEFNEDYGTTYDEIDDLHEVTTVIKIDDDSFIVQQF